MDISPTAQRLCSILSFDPLNKSRLDTIAPNDWQPIVNLARQQNLIPLLYQRIKVLGIGDSIPANVFNAMHNQYLRSAACNIQLYRQFDTILAGLDFAHIPVIPIKGIYLAQEIYKNPALRPMSDIDILVKVEDVGRTVDILRSLGYQPTRPFDLRNEFKFHRHLPAFIKPSSSEIEVHTTLQEPSDPYNIDLAALWVRAGETRFGNRKVTSLDPHDLLLYLCINVAFHDLFSLGLRGLYDLGAVIAHFQTALDWDELYKRSLAWRAGRLVYITLSLARKLLNANVPTEFLAHLTPPHFDESVFSTCTDFIFTSPVGADLPVTPDLEQFMRVANPWVKFRILLNRLFIPRSGNILLL